MKSTIIYLLLVLSLIQCKGQNEKGVTYPKEKIMTSDTFDIEKYNKIVKEKKDRGDFDLYNHSEILLNGNVKESEQDQNGTFSVTIIPPPPSIFETYKSYYKNGFLKYEVQRYLGLAMSSDQVKFGTSKFYDETGRLIKTVDELAKYENIKIKPLILFEILKKEPVFVNLTKEQRIHFKQIFQLTEKEDEIRASIVQKTLKKQVILNPNDREDVKNVFLTLSKNEKNWFVVKDLYPFGRVELNIDTNSGKIISREYTKETRP